MGNSILVLLSLWACAVHQLLNHLDLLLNLTSDMSFWIDLLMRLVTHILVFDLILILSYLNLLIIFVNVISEIQTYFQLIILLLSTNRFWNFCTIFLSFHSGGIAHLLWKKVGHLCLVNSALLILLLLCSMTRCQNFLLLSHFLQMHFFNILIVLILCS